MQNPMDPAATFAIVLMQDMTDEQYARASTGERIDPDPGQRHLRFRYPSVNEHLRFKAQRATSEREFAAAQNQVESAKNDQEKQGALRALETAGDRSLETLLSGLNAFYVGAEGFATGNTEQSGAEQSRAEQSRAEQSGAEQSSAPLCTTLHHGAAKFELGDLDAGDLSEVCGRLLMEAQLRSIDKKKFALRSRSASAATANSAAADAAAPPP